MTTAYSFYIKLTNSCNLHCDHCYNSIMLDRFIMTDETIVKVANYLRDFRNKHPDDYIIAALHGGEPLMCNTIKINRLLNLTDDLNIFWSATTNLVYDLTDDKIELFKRFKQKDGSTLLLTSFDYKIRFKDNQEQIWRNNVKKLLKEGISVQPIISLTNLIIKDITPYFLFSYFNNLKINRVNFERLTNNGRAVENNLRPNNSDLDNWLMQAYLTNKEFFNFTIPLFNNIELAVSKQEFIECRRRKCEETVITINPNGTICGCPNRPDLTYTDLDNNLDNSKYKSNCLKERNIDTRCLSCEYYKYCNGDCHQLSFDDTGCPGMKSIIKYLLNKN